MQIYLLMRLQKFARSWICEHKKKTDLQKRILSKNLKETFPFL